MNSGTKVSLIGTPIGNLGDISKRTIDALEKADIVFAEDTRTAANLLNYIGLRKKILSCHKDNEKSASDKIVNEVSCGNHVAIISEAGMPCISDPGSEVVKRLINEHILFEVISGPTAFVHGLITSGFSGGPFMFYGFLPHKISDKKKTIEHIKKIAAPIVFYESPHRVKDTIEILLENFTPPIACCRELTKIHEETIFIQNKEDIERITVKGEFVLVVDNSSISHKDKPKGFDTAGVGKKLLEEGFTPHEIVRILKVLGVKRNDAYKAVITNNS